MRAMLLCQLAANGADSAGSIGGGGQCTKCCFVSSLNLPACFGEPGACRSSRACGHVITFSRNSSWKGSEERGREPKCRPAWGLGPPTWAGAHLGRLLGIEALSGLRLLGSGHYVQHGLMLKNDSETEDCDHKRMNLL